MNARLSLLPALCAVSVLVLASAAGSATSATKPPLKIMVLSQWDSGFLDLGDLPIIVNNAARWANARGGINGAKVEVISCNDKNDPNQAEKCAREAVDKKVVALVGGFTLWGNRVFPVLEQAKIPWIGLIGVQPIDNTSPVSYPFTGGPLLTLAPAALAGRTCKRTALAVNDTATATSVPYLQAGMRSQGKEFVSTTLIPSRATDMVPYVVQMRAKNPDCIVLTTVESQYYQLIPALKAAGAIGKHRFYTINPGGFTERVVAQFPSETEGWVNVAYFPLVDRPVWSEYRTINNRYNNLGKYKANLGAGSEQRSYIGFKVLKQVAGKMKGNVTGPALLKALNKSCDVRTGGLAPKMNFCKENPVPELRRLFNTSFSFYVVRRGKFAMFSSGFQDMLPNFLRGKK